MNAKRLVMLDLCCGLGGASRAMRERGWTVVGIDREADVKPDIVADVRQLSSRPFHIDLLWCSTDCAKFTRCVLPWKNRAQAKSELDLSVELAVKRLISDWRPRSWVVENTIPARRWLTPMFGPVRAIAGGHVLWSNLALLVPDLPARKTAMGPQAGGERGRYLKRSLIPYEISLAVARAVEAL